LPVPSDEVAVASRGPIAAGGDAVPAIHAVDLTKRYGHIEALAGLSMSVPRGEIFGFLGPNGAGKTTAVKLLLGLTTPTAGDAWLLGEPIGRAEARRRVGYLPELFRYPAWLSPVEVLQFHCRLIGVPGSERGIEIDSALTVVGLHERGRDRVGTFSKGMQQRLGLAVAMLGAPEIVFLDEPTSALDPVGRHDVREIIRDLRGRGTAVFLNSHLLSEVEQVCDRVAVVDRGRVIAAGTMDQLLSGTTVKVRATGLDREGKAKLASFGHLDDEGDQLTFTNLNTERVPELVAAIVALGGRVYEVAPRQQTLEDRFLQLIQDEEDK